MYVVSPIAIAAARLALNKQAWNAGEAMLDDSPMLRDPAIQQRINMRQPVSPADLPMPPSPVSFQPLAPHQPQPGQLSQMLRPPPTQDPLSEIVSPLGEESPPQSPPGPSPYEGLAPEEQQFVEQQGATPDPVAAPASPPDAPEIPMPSPPPGRFQHVIDDTQRMLVGTKQRLAEAQASGNARLASQLQRHVANAEQRVADMQQRQGFGQDEYKGWLAQQGVSNPDQRAEQLFAPGGQADWYQQAASNSAAGRPQYAGISAHSPGKPPTPVPPVTTSGQPATVGTSQPSPEPQAPSDAAIADHMQKYPYLNRWRSNSPLRDGSPQFAAEFPHLNQLNTQSQSPHPPMPSPNPELGSLAAK